MGLVAPAAATARRYEPTAASLARHPRPAWWEGGKFGIFIHWGPYAVPAFGAPAPPVSSYAPAEWYWLPQQIPGTEAWRHHLQTFGPNVVYDDFLPRFRAERFDPAAWVRLFERAGARYFVLTAKHHDGFALWCSDTTGRDACDTGPRRDLVGALFAAAHRAGDRVKPGLYYSIPEFFNPAPKPSDAYVGPYASAFSTGLSPRNAYTQLPVPYTGQPPKDDYAGGIVRPQLRELIARYHPYELWCDIGGRESYFHANEIIAEYFNQASAHTPGGVVVDDRCGDSSTHSDYATVEQGAGFAQQPGSRRSETARTMGESWGYDLNEALTARRSADTLVDGLVSAVAANSNFLLNIGPAPDGTIPDWQQERLLDIGAWLRINGEAIYGSRPWTQPADGDVRFTAGRDGFLYAAMLRWPGTQLRLTAPVPLVRGTRVALLGSDERPLPVRRDGDATVITLPAGSADAATRSRHAYVLRIGARRRARLLVSWATRPGAPSVTARLVPPAGLTRGVACRGTITLTAVRAGRVVRRRRAPLPASCRIGLRLPRRGVERIRARFSGNPVLRPAAAAST